MGDFVLICCFFYKVFQKFEEVVNNEIENMLKMGIICFLVSFWVFLVVVVFKFDGII